MRVAWLLLVTAFGAAAAPRIREVDLWVPSETAQPDGLAVRLAIPPEGRYHPEAPIVVHVAGGWGGGNIAQIQAPLAALGFIEVRFGFPGGGGPRRSGGVQDMRGAASVAALADVLAFAGGLAPDREGRRIGELTAPLRPLTEQVGVIGWSNGGNAAILAIAEHRTKVQGVAWVATWESPVGDGAATALLGGHREGVNPAYDPKTGLLDYSSLAYNPDLPIAVFGGPGGARGAFYFDLNHNRRTDDRDWVPRALPAPTPGERRRYAYPRSLTEAAEQRKLVRAWPAHILSAAEAGEFWDERDAAGHFLKAAINRLDLIAMVIGTTRDHVQAAPDHPHIYAAYHGWLDADCQWVRLNPDACYLAAVAGAEGTEEWVETVAGMPLTRRATANQLVPAGTVSNALLGAAAAAELADRVYDQNFAVDLEAVLHPTRPVPSRPRNRPRPAP